MADDPDSSSLEGVRTDPDSGGGSSEGLTDAQLRASPVPVSGEVSLAALTLAALETVGLDAATLAALETTELGAATLAALEAITVTVSGSVTITDGSGPVTVDGTVAVTGNVEVVNDVGNPLPISGTVTITDGSGPVTVDGTVAVIGNVEVVNDVGNPLPISGTVTITDGSGPVTVDGTVTITDGSGPVTVDGTVDTELPAAAALADAAGNPTTPMVGGATLVFNGSNWDRARGDTTNGVDVDVTRLPNAATPSQSSVSSSASNVTVLASNSARKGATVYNDSTQVLYLKLGATASSSSHTVQIAAGGYYEVPFGYTGIIDGIWASANGSARVTELT